MKKMKLTLCLFLLLASMISIKAQVAQGFENYTFPPTGWTKFGDDSWTAQTNSAYAHTGSGAAKSNSHTGSSALVTPRLTPTSTANTFKFWVRCFSNSWDELSESINIKVSTTGNGEFDSWTTLLTLDSSQTNATFQEKIVDLSAYVDQNIYIAIEVIGDNGNNFYIDDVTMPNLYVNPCASPSSITASTLSSTASISWTGETPAFYNVDYRVVGATTWISTTSFTNSKNLTGLTSNTNYEIRMQKVCGAELSAWSTTTTFHTLCPSTSIPYLEGFESITSNNQLPSCMIATNLGSQVYTYISAQSTFNRSAHTGVKFLSFKYSSNDWALTPTFDMLSGTTYEFSFWYKVDGSAPFDSLKVYAGNGQSIVAMNQQIGSSITNVNNTAYQKFSGTFTPSTDGVYSFGIKVVASSSPEFLTIDDIALNLYNPLACADPAFVTSSNNTTNTVNLAWDGTAANYRVQYRTVGTTDWSYTNLISTPSTILTGLSPFQSYEIQIRSICSATDSSGLSPIYVATTAQTPATLPYSTSFETDPIDWTMAQESQTNYWTAGSSVASDGTRSMYISNDGTANAYTTNTASVSHIYRDIEFPTSTTGYSLTFDWKCNGEYSYDFLKVYLIDVNTNATPGAPLNDTYRIGATKYNTQTSWQNAVISLPASLSGTTKRLVFSWINDNGGGANPPAAIDNINITSGPIASVCNAPTLLYTNNVTENYATLAWASAATNFNIRYRAVGATSWISSYTYATTMNVYSLSDGTEYEFQVQTVCSSTAGDTSAWSASSTFTTENIPCQTPVSLTTNSITQTGAIINWIGMAESFNIEYRLIGESNWLSANSINTSLTLTGLSDASQYEFRVYAICSATLSDSSDWSAIATFTTLPTLNCACPTQLTASNITTSGAELSWTNGGTETSWNIRFKKATSSIYSSASAISQKPFILSGLQINSAYVWNIQANCSATPGDTSCWSEEGTFNTLNDVSISENEKIDFSIYSSNQTINVINNNSVTIKEVIVYDLLGQEVNRFSINSNENVLINTNLAKSHYLVKVLTDKQVITKKITIK